MPVTAASGRPVYTQPWQRNLSQIHSGGDQMAKVRNQVAQLGMGTIVAGLKAVESSASRERVGQG